VGVAAQIGEPDRAIGKCSRSRTVVRWLHKTYRSLVRCSGSIRCSIRSEMIRVSKNSPSRKRRN